MDLVVQWSPTHEVFLYIGKKSSIFRGPSKALCLGASRSSRVTDGDLTPFNDDGRRRGPQRFPWSTSRENSALATSKGIESSSHLRQLLRNGELDKGLKFLESTVNCGMEPDIAACSDVIWRFIKVGRAGNAQRAMDIIESAGLAPNVKTYTALINALCKDGEVDRALDVLYHMKVTPNVITYTPILKGLCKRGESDQALNILDGMKVEPNVITYATILDGLCKHGKLEQALNFLENMKVMPNVITYNIILDGLYKHRKLEKVLNVLDNMKVAPDVITYNTIMDGLCKHGKLEQALNLLDSIEVVPDVITYNTILDGFCKYRLTGYAIDVLSYMVSKGCKPDESTYNILCDGVASEGFNTEAEELRNELRARGVM